MHRRSRIPEEAASTQDMARLIAVVDDNESVRKALGRLLRSSGYTVETFSSGSAFLEFAQRVHPACVVLDLHMPVLSGFEVQSALSLAGAAIPVIMITGGSGPNCRARAFGLGASAFLSKPLDESRLLDAIKSTIGP